MIKQLTYLLTLASFILVSAQLMGQVTTTKTANGPWTNASKWNNGIPTSIDDAIINTGNTNANSNGECNDLEIKIGNSLNVGATLTVNGALNIESGVSLQINGNIVVNDSISLNSTKVMEMGGGITFYAPFDIGQ